MQDAPQTEAPVNSEGQAGPTIDPAAPGDVMPTPAPTPKPSTSRRFDYVAYDAIAKEKQERFKGAFEALEVMGGDLPDGRAKSLFLTALEEAYMWTGKAIRDEQIARVPETPHEAARTNE